MFFRAHTPDGIIERVTQQQRSYMWSSKSTIICPCFGKRAYHLFNWERVVKSRQGGIVIGISVSIVCIFLYKSKWALFPSRQRPAYLRSIIGPRVTPWSRARIALKPLGRYTYSNAISGLSSR